MLGKFHRYCKDAETQLRISEAQLSMIDSSGVLVTSIVSDSIGAFSIDVDCNTNDLRLVINKEGYDTKTMESEVVPDQVNRVK